MPLRDARSSLCVAFFGGLFPFSSSTKKNFSTLKINQNSQKQKYIVDFIANFQRESTEVNRRKKVFLSKNLIMRFDFELIFTSSENKLTRKNDSLPYKRIYGSFLSCHHQTAPVNKNTKL